MTTDTPNRETNSEGTQRNQENQPEQTSSNQLELSRRSAIRRLGAAGFVGSFGLTRSATANSGRWASKEGGNPGKGKPDNVPIPAGKKVPESKVVEKPKAGEHLSRFFDKKPASGKTIHYENENLTPTPEVEGWQGKTTAQLPDGEKFGYMAGDLVVPPAPSSPNADDVFFFFPAFQNDGSPLSILQPVLTWNWGGSGEWEIAAWWGPNSDGKYPHSPLLPVSPGDTLGCYMIRENIENPTTWYIEINDKNNSWKYTDLRTEELDRGEFRYAFTAFELYNFESGDCTALPGDADFSDMYWEDNKTNEVTFSWSKYDGDIGCYLNTYAFSTAETYYSIG